MKCEKCDREFSSQEGLEQHMRDKHGTGVSRHDMREKRKEERAAQAGAEAKKAKSRKLIKRVSIALVVILIIAGAGLFLATLKPAESNYDVSGFPNGFIHWHADVNVIVCGENRKLPEGLPGSFIGTERLHTHDKAQNINSLPGSDGNGIVHTEGNVRALPQEHTLGKFMSNIGVRFGNETIMDKKNGDTCPDGSVGTVKVFLNGNPLGDPVNYLLRDKDLIRIEFS